MKMKKWLCIILCCGLLLTTIAACENGGSNGGDPVDPPGTQDPPPPAAIYTLDFADGKTDFLMMNTGSPGTDKDSKFEVANVDGASALKMTAPNAKSLRLGINVSGLLGDKAKDVRTIVFDIYAEYPDGNFSAVSGVITAMSDDLIPFAETNWQIYLESRNPNPTTLNFAADEAFGSGANLIEFACLTNGPADRGETPAVIVIKSIEFFDSSNAGISLNTAAGWSAPEGYGDDVFLGGWLLPYPPELGRPGDWQTWHTPGVDGNDADYLPWEVLAASFGIEFEMDQPEESFGLVMFGEFNGWNSQMWGLNFAENWADGYLTIMWEDIRDHFDPALVTEDSSQVKISMANWNEVDIEKAYILYDEDAMP